MNHTFESFKKLSGTIEALEIMKALANGENKLKFILLYGERGTGKTHLIEATIIRWSERGIYCRYQTASNIMRMLKQSFSPDAKTDYSVLFSRLCDAEKLIIDDYGMGIQETRFEVSDLEDIVNERYHKRFRDDAKVTIIATNKDIKDMPDRIVSRFYDPEFGKAILLDAQDYRRRAVK